MKAIDVDARRKGREREAERGEAEEDISGGTAGHGGGGDCAPNAVSA